MEKREDAGDHVFCGKLTVEKLHMKGPTRPVTRSSHTLYRTLPCSDASFSNKGVKYVFKIASSFSSESANASRSSTLPIKFNSFSSEEAAEVVEDIVVPRLTLCYIPARSHRNTPFFISARRLRQSLLACPRATEAYVILRASQSFDVEAICRQLPLYAYVRLWLVISLP